MQKNSLKEQLQFNSKNYQFQRYPSTTNRSLKVASASDLLVSQYILGHQPESITTFNDKFGVWATLFYKQISETVITHASQQKAIALNLELNSLANLETESFKQPLDILKAIDFAVVKIPKSLDLFELFVQQIHQSATKDTIVVCGFMTKYFSPKILAIAQIYFDSVEQSRAWKKSRLLILKQPKKDVLDYDFCNEINWKDSTLKHYKGVFSADKIDIGTRFLLENFQLKPSENKVLDLACGNGIIGFDLLQRQPNLQITFVDDFNLAIASAKQNCNSNSHTFICDNNLNALPDDTFDLIICNPPFHFEYENNIEVSLGMFEEVAKKLKPSGRFVLVANSHLNYKTHLVKWFNLVEVTHQNQKFQIISCSL